MAGQKTYVNIVKPAIKDIFDAKYKSSLPSLMQKIMEKAVKSSGKLTLDAPKDKGAKGWSVDGSLVSLAPDKSGKKLEAECSLVISTWPGKSIKAMPGGKSSIVIAGNGSIDPGDVQALAEGVVTGAMSKAVDYMEKNAP
jgi:hypothetical protein